MLYDKGTERLDIESMTCDLLYILMMFNVIPFADSVNVREIERYSFRMIVLKYGKK